MYLVYRINECNYIGMTKNIEDRKRTHKLSLNPNNPKYNRKLYKFIRDNILDFDKLTFKVLKDNLPDKETAEKWETTFMIFYNSIDNGTNTYYSAFSDIRQKEWHKVEKNKVKMKKYRDQNKERTKETNKEYRANNKERYRLHKLKYLIKNKDKINEKNRTKVKCDECHRVLSYSSLNRHKKKFHSK